MLHPPYTKYERLYMYHLDCRELPEITDPDLIGAWTEDDAAVIFFHKNKDELIQQLCARVGASIIYQADLDYRDWEAGQYVTGFTIKDLTVAPVWEDVPADIKLDPSVIFGSGFHHSTRLCLEAVIDRARETKIDSMLDLGCGTGLLAIAAAKQGVGHITAIDHNPLACRLATVNGERNGVAAQLEVKQMDLREQTPVTQGKDLVVANLFRELHLSLFRRPEYWHAKFYILAGFIGAMERELFAALPEEHLRIVERRERDRWCLWMLENTRDLP